MKINTEIDKIFKIDKSKLETKEDFNALKERDVSLSEYTTKAVFNQFKNPKNIEYPTINIDWETTK